MSADTELGVITDDVLTQHILGFTLAQVPEYKIPGELEKLGLPKISRHRVRKLRGTEDFKTALRKMGEEAANSAVAAFRSKLEELWPLAYEALKANLQDKKLDAVRVFGEFAGIRDRKPEEGNAAAITLVMPGAKLPTDKETIDV